MNANKPSERYNVTAGRPYTTRDGVEKRQWINVGRATKWDNGSISIEMHAIPVGGWWDGRLALFVDDGSKQAGRPSPSPSPKRTDDLSEPFIDDDIPF